MDYKRKMPIGIQDFQKLRENGFVYVDKTALIYDLVQSGVAYFLSRPRRFGKSLLISTLESYFLGKKELFSGLEIEKQESEWEKYPVLHFDFNGQDYSDTQGLVKIIEYHLAKWEKKYGIEQKIDSFGLRLATIITAANEQTGKKVVVLVDEYDKPLLETMNISNEIMNCNIDILKGMFGQLKSLDRYLHFVLFTGVTKFSRVSIFSDLNQLQDISMHPRYATLCGITQEELERNFEIEIEQLAFATELTKKECLSRLKKLYDGYHFTRNCPDIYNPFSLINAFSRCDFGKYWFSTGTPTFLAKHLKETGFDPRKLSDGSLYTSEDEISDYRPDNPDIIPLLYQTGYLTIKNYEARRRIYTLSYPNEEVKYGFSENLAPVYLYRPQNTGMDIFAIDDALEKGDTEKLHSQFIALFANLPYAAGANDTMLERDFQNVIYIVFLLLGQFVRVEQHTAKGRVDCIVETQNYVYIFEFKRDSSAVTALSQIASQGYAAPYEADNRILIKIGANFSSSEKNITEWKVVR